MQKIYNLVVGSKRDLGLIDNSWAIVHACKTSHQGRLGYTKPIKDSPYYIVFQDGNQLYINWVDEPSGKYFKVETFKEAMDFIDDRINTSQVFIHCDQGESRAPTLAMTYLAKRTNYLEDDFLSAYNAFCGMYRGYNPSGIVKFVKQNWLTIN